MQVGFSPVNFQQRQNKTHQVGTLSLSSNREQGLKQSTNFGCKIPVEASISRIDLLTGKIKKGIHEDSPENRVLLKEVVTQIKKRFGKNAKWDIQDIKESALGDKSPWKKDDELKEIFKGY